MGRQYSEKFKKQIVTASYVDGESVASVARRFEVNDYAIYYWRKRYDRPIDESITSVDASSNFIPITVSSEEEPLSQSEAELTQSADTWQVTISMGLNRSIKIDGAFNLESLIKLVRGVAV